MGQSQMQAVSAYIGAYEKLFSDFKCPGRYFVKPVTDCAWRVSGDEDMHILSYAAQNAVVVRQDGQPLVYRASGYAMVIAIDCVKIAFLLDESRELKS